MPFCFGALARRADALPREAACCGCGSGHPYPGSGRGGLALQEKLIGFVIALDHPHAARLEDDQMVGHAVDEVAVVAHEEHRAVEGRQGLLQGVAGPKIEMVRRLVEHEEIGVGRGQPGQGHAVPLAAAELAHLLQGRVARDAEAGQQVAALLRQELLVPGPDGIDHVVIVRHAGEVLIEVADAHARADLHGRRHRAAVRPAGSAARSTCRSRWDRSIPSARRG